MKFNLTSFCTIFALIYGEYTFAKDQEGIVERRRQRFESITKDSTPEKLKAPSKLSQQLEQISEDMRNNQKWTKNAITGLKQELQETKEEIIQIKQYMKSNTQESNDSSNDLKQQLKEMKLEEEALKDQIAKLILQLEQDVKEEAQKTSDINPNKENQDKLYDDSYVISDNKIILKDWMTTYYHSIKDKLLKDIVIPGTHDSGTAAIPEKGAEWSSDGRGVSIPFTEKDENFSVPWSKTQDLTIKEQLDIGVRFFDFRVSVEKNNELYLSHGLRGEKLSDSLAAIANFCEKYPKELVIIKVKGIPDKQCKDVDGNKLIKQLFEKYLKDLLISKTDVPQLSLTKYSDLIKNGNIVVLFDVRVSNKLNILKAKEKGTLMKQTLKETDWLFDGECLESHHANTPSTEKLFNFSKKVAKDIEYDKERRNKLFALHWTLTANAKYIGGHVKNAFGIRYMTSKLNGGKLYGESYRLEDLIRQIPRVNIVQHDFIDKDKSAYLIRLNLKSQEKVEPATASNKVLQKLKSIYHDIHIKRMQ
jgi:hypothetical protein